MTGRLFRWTGGVLFAITLTALIGITWLVATQSGARWLLAQASSRLPAALSIGSVDGTLIRGLQFRNVAWQDPSAAASIAELATHVELLPLLKREVRITTLALENVTITISEGAGNTEASDPLSVDIPVRLQLENGSIESLRIVTPGSEFLVDTIQLSGELAGSELDIRRFDLQSTLADIALSGNARLAGDYPAHASAGWELRLQDQAPLSGILGVRGEASRYEIQHDLDAPYAVATQGTVALTSAGISLDLDNRCRAVCGINVDIGHYAGSYVARNECRRHVNLFLHRKSQVHVSVLRHSTPRRRYLLRRHVGDGLQHLHDYQTSEAAGCRCHPAGVRR